MQVKNQREYAAVLKEIDAVKAHVAEHEDAILKAMDELETLNSDLESRAAHIEEERIKVETEVADVEREAAVAAERADQSEGERAAIEVELPRDLVDAVRRVEEARSGIFLVRAEAQVCQSCHVRIRPQVYQEIKLAARIHACGNCRRFLYYEPALRAEAGRRAPGRQRPGDGDAWRLGLGRRSTAARAGIPDRPPGGSSSWTRTTRYLEGHAGTLGRATNNVAEYDGLLEALALAAERGADDVEIRADSELIVRQVQGRYKVRHPDLIPLHAEAMRRISRFPRFRIVHVPREKNKDADRLVNRALDLGARPACCVDAVDAIPGERRLQESVASPPPAPASGRDPGHGHARRGDEDRSRPRAARGAAARGRTSSARIASRRRWRRSTRWARPARWHLVGHLQRNKARAGGRRASS